MASSGQMGYAFIVLLSDEDDAMGLARLLDDVKLPDAAVPAAFLAPPTRGKAFFADDSVQADIDSWWAENVPRNDHPVFLLEHEPGLLEWIEGLDGSFYIGVNTVQDGQIYEASKEIKSFIAHGPLDFAAIVMREFSGGNGTGDDIFDQGEAIRMAALSADFPIDFDDSDFYPEEDVQQGNPLDTPLPQANDPFTSPFSSPYPPPTQQTNTAAPRPAPSRPKEILEPATPNPFDLLSSGTGVGSSAPTPVSNYDSPVPPPQAAPPPQAPQRPASAGTPSPPPSPFASQPQQQEWSPSDPLLPPSALNPYPGAPGSGSGLWGGNSGFEGLPTTPPPTQWQGGQSSQGSAGVPPIAPGAYPQIPAGNGNPAGLTPGGGYQQPAPSGKERKKVSLPAIFNVKKGSKGGFRETPNADFAQWMVNRGPTIVVMGSRKGGVGKTSFAAAVAIVAGTVLDSVGHKAAIVDANIANPDAWGQMNLPNGAATVRETVAALTANREVPAPVFASTPALACYPEDRETSEYSKTDIRRLADYLKRRYTFIVVDMSNRLPDPMAGPEAAAAAYWLELADVLVLPTTSSKQDFNGVLDYLDVRDLPPTVVPYIVPKAKKNREHPATQQYLSTIRGRVQAIVEVPDEADTVRLAGMQGVPVEQMSPTLRMAYRELTEVVVRCPARMGRR